MKSGHYPYIATTPPSLFQKRLRGHQVKIIPAPTGLLSHVFHSGAHLNLLCLSQMEYGNATRCICVVMFPDLIVIPPFHQLPTKVIFYENNVLGFPLFVRQKPPGVKLCCFLICNLEEGASLLLEIKMNTQTICS